VGPGVVMFGFGAGGARSGGLLRKIIVRRLLSTVSVLACVASAASKPPSNGQIAFARQLPGGGADIFIPNLDET
jgi:hypothetical protein